MERKVKSILYVIMLSVLALPYVQMKIPFCEVTKLYGAYSDAPDADFTWRKWFDGDYQQQKEKFHNDQIGFRHELVRMNNQIDFSLFYKIHADVVLGEKNCLFQQPYIDAYYGGDFQGREAIRNKLVMLKAVQDTFSKMGKSIIVVHTPNKAWFYPELIPRAQVKASRDSTNYETCRQIADSLAINQIDFNSWFVALKHTSNELLYSLQGIHWTVYGSLIAADSLIGRMEQLQHIQMPHPTWDKTHRTVEARFTDNDIGKLLNMYFPVKKEKFSYPEVRWEQKPDQTRPNVIYLGDSFIWNLLDNCLMAQANGDWQFWDNLKIVYGPTYLSKGETKEWERIDWMSAIDSMDFLLLMYTPHNFHRFGDGLIEKLHQRYYPGK